MADIKTISDEKVKAATGKTLDEWFRIFDQANVKDWSHTDRATWLYNNHLKKGWWCQMVTVQYEQVRGLRKLHERPDGYQISVSKTYEKPIGELYKQWLKEPVDYTTKHENKVLRGKWQNGGSVDIYFYPKPKSKVQVVVTHSKIANDKEADKMKEYWKKRLEHDNK